jgi:DNA (cytosine-5)-methyltransferase 1
MENVAAIVTGDGGRMLRTVVGDLAERGYNAVWTCLSAAEVGAAHKRNRWWLLSYPKSKGARLDIGWVRGMSKRCGKGSEGVAHPNEPYGERDQRAERGEAQPAEHEQHGRRQAKPALGMLADDVAYNVDGWSSIEAQVGRTTEETQNRADKLKALGNGQVPLQAAVAFSVLWEMMEAAGR